jgi:cytochrome c oxidase subunit 1
MQAMSRADVQLPGRTAHVYYLSVTVHGVLMALVFTTFFIMGFGYVVAFCALDRPIARPALAWASFWIAVAGTALTVGAILSGTSNVLYTFYPPLMAHPTFYIGAALSIVGSWGWSGVMLLSLRARRTEHPRRPVPLSMHGIVTTVIVWLLCTIEVAIEVVVLLIPWSLRWTKTIDPLLARTLFWYFGHPLVYFWLLPAYVAWYSILPRAAGGKLFSNTA